MPLLLGIDLLWASEREHKRTWQAARCKQRGTGEEEERTAGYRGLPSDIESLKILHKCTKEWEGE